MAESASEHNVLPENFSMRIQLQYMKFMLRAGFTKKKVLFFWILSKLREGVICTKSKRTAPFFSCYLLRLLERALAVFMNIKWI